MERGYGAPSQTYPLGAKLPRIARNRGSLHLPYLEIKLTFECTAWFYGLAPPLSMFAISNWPLLKFFPVKRRIKVRIKIKEVARAQRAYTEWGVGTTSSLYNVVCIRTVTGGVVRSHIRRYVRSRPAMRMGSYRAPCYKRLGLGLVRGLYIHVCADF